MYVIHNFLKLFAGHLKINFSRAIYIRKRSGAAKISILIALILICSYTLDLLDLRNPKINVDTQKRYISNPKAF